MRVKSYAQVVLFLCVGVLNFELLFVVCSVQWMDEQQLGMCNCMQIDR